ncbi:gamma-glutamylcyclotransferase (GGCT)/AIG2-like uncharacterized protein YtfP [Zhongshania antarctica]|uniref:Putative gamma-glutamylcyclotransferase n=1 Tax=Zhongshania antarctica TaxID=641702 RepID=A0A840QYT5_9GAMM|nr:gamma-glutamylcyclotransferase family protein [Zhongshania antarctica]MBB5185875.1 gamma-glutamylcyclotransferase (GGCT)/AIG2-like uncharacterized protein YtfP [Zhongshania antarctica]
MANVFTYGSLMCADIMATVSGVSALSESALLRNYRRYAVLDEDYPALIAEAGAETHGLLYRNISDEGLRRLDVFEGDYYQRCELVVALLDGCQVSAQTYVFRADYRHLIADWPWSFEHFLNVGKSNFENAYLGFQQLPSQG